MPCAGHSVMMMMIEVLWMTLSNMIRTIGQICILSANLASESYCDFLLHADRHQFVALPLRQSCERRGRVIPDWQKMAEG